MAFFCTQRRKYLALDARAGWIRSVITISLLRTLLIRVGVEVVGVGVVVPIIADGVELISILLVLACARGQIAGFPSIIVHPIKKRGLEWTTGGVSPMQLPKLEHRYGY